MSKINKYTIHEPIWDGGTKERAIGIAEFRLPCIVDIDHKNSEGKKTFPHKYMIKGLSSAEKFIKFLFSC